MGKWKKLTAFAPALAAVIVAACAGISLNGYTALVYAVEQPEALVTPEPEQDTDAAEKKDDTKKKGVIDRIIASQSVDVDTVSGATFSSKGILAAVKNALTGQEDTSEPASASGAAGGGASAGGTVTVSKIEEPAAYRYGTYYGTGTGFGGTMKVCVVVSGGKIASIDMWKTAIRQATFPVLPL